MLEVATSEKRPAQERIRQTMSSPRAGHGRARSPWVNTHPVPTAGTAQQPTATAVVTQHRKCSLSAWKTRERLREVARKRETAPIVGMTDQEDFNNELQCSQHHDLQIGGKKSSETDRIPRRNGQTRSPGGMGRHTTVRRPNRHVGMR